MAIMRTRTKTYALYNAWAETIPYEKDAPDYKTGPRVDDPCCEPQCDETLHAGEVVYAVTELGREHANPGRNEPWVCWRHVRPDQGPITVTEG